MECKIHIGKVEIPLVDYAVGASAVLGIRDSGKTVTSKGIAEQLLDNQVPIVVFDAVGKWRWLKAPGEGNRGKGYKVVVAGGRVPDLPLTPHSVTEIVRAAMKERIPLVIDLFDKHLSKADWRRIVQQAIHIIHYENEGGALHVFLEEAAEFVPQKVFDGETYAEVEKLVRMGGNASVGITLINQRSQEVNKAVLDNCSTALVLGCQVGKNAIEAVGKWIERLDPDVATAVTQSLPKLQSGSAWVWTRKSLDQPSLERMPMCRSFHPDRRTPKAVLSKLTRTDTAGFVAKLADSIPQVIEQAKANDPALLKRELAEARRELKGLREKAAREDARPIKAEVKVVEKPVLKEKQLERVEVFAERLERWHNELVAALKAAVPQSPIANRQSMAPSPSPHGAREFKRNGLHPARAERRALPERGGRAGSAELSKAARKILAALKQYHPTPLTKRRVALLAGYSVNGGGFGNGLGECRSRGLIVGSGDLSITPAGLTAAGDVEPLPTGEELSRYWLSHPDLGRAEREILRVLLEAGGPLSKEEVAARTSSATGEPYEADGGGFGNGLGRLRTLELVEGQGSALRVVSELVET